MPGSEHAHRYFDWEWRDGEFHYFEHAVNFAREKVLEGKYVMQTEESDLGGGRTAGGGSDAVGTQSSDPARGPGNPHVATKQKPAPVFSMTSQPKTQIWASIVQVWFVFFSTERG